MGSDVDGDCLGLAPTDLPLKVRERGRVSGSDRESKSGRESGSDSESGSDGAKVTQ